MNATALSGSSPSPYPLYYSPNSTLIDGLTDHHLSLAAPILAYWSLSLFFHYLDISGWKWLEKYRLHEPTEVQSRNLATRSEVVWAVLLQQVIQTLLGLATLSDDTNERVVDHFSQIRAITIRLRPTLSPLLGKLAAPLLLQNISYFIYWWGIPCFQFIMAMFIIDTWQYFLHRLMHVNKLLYKHFHSWHHRLYVPYAFGSLYNHPIEGFCLDSLGALIAQLLTGMNARQATLFFIISTFKTVDDHCGYSLPFDPLQLITSNNADYHDIHHQAAGIKSNFAQPFFVHWDMILGTRMTRKDLEQRRKRQDPKAD